MKFRRDSFDQIPYFRYIWICVVSKDINYDGAIKVHHNFGGFLSGFKTFQHITDFGLTGTASKTCRKIGTARQVIVALAWAFAIGEDFIGHFTDFFLGDFGCFSFTILRNGLWDKCGTSHKDDSYQRRV
jgi:hypothetical protein